VDARVSSILLILGTRALGQKRESRPRGRSSGGSASLSFYSSIEARAGGAGAPAIDPKVLLALQRSPIRRSWRAGHGHHQKDAGTHVDFPGQVLASRARIVAVTARDARPRGLTDTW
jgi:hypothetical protein